MGNIEVAGLTSGGELKTSTGTIEVHLNNEDIDINAKTDVGKIENTFTQDKPDKKFVGAKLKTTKGHGGVELKLRSDTGNIKIRELKGLGSDAVTFKELPTNQGAELASTPKAQVEIPTPESGTPQNVEVAGAPKVERKETQVEYNLSPEAQRVLGIAKQTYELLGSPNQDFSRVKELLSELPFEQQDELLKSTVSQIQTNAMRGRPLEKLLFPLS